MRTPARRLLNLRVLAPILVATAALGLASQGSLAFWVDGAPAAPGSISSGSIDLKVDGADNDTAFTSLSMSGMTPGNSTAAVITVRNGGLSPLTYFVDAAASNADGLGLGSALVVKVTGAGSVSGTSPSRSCSGAALPGAGSAFAPNLVASASPRSLSPGQQETLCVQATLPSSTGPSLYNATTNVTFALHAKQVIP